MNMNTLLYLKWITNKDPLYSTGNCLQCYEAAWMGGEFGGEKMYIYTRMGLVAQLCLTLCNPVDCSPPGSSVHGDSPGTNTGVGCHALLQGIFPTQESKPSFLHCRWILYHLSHQGAHAYVYVRTSPFAVHMKLSQHC